ncbi:MAG: hypothetical protein AABX98_01120 [Nanoarchaeota archaeon]
MQKGQAAIEFLFVVGFAMMLIIPSLALFGMFVQETSDTVTRGQVNKIGNYMMNTATQAYHGTNGTIIVIEVNFPKGVTNLTVPTENELVFTFEEGTTGVAGEAVFYSDIPLNGTFTDNDVNEGIKKFKFTATESGSVVLIERVQKY